jgi:type II secretory pathway component GspD/PulD (secretin)
MKKTAYYILLAGLAGALTANAQTNPAVPAELPVAATNPAEVVLTDTNAVAPAATNSAPAPIEADTNTAPQAPAAAAVPAPATTITNAPETATPAGDIPLVQFSDVPITTAIENLARQAGINFMFDPKISYGQPDQNGQPKPEPQLSIRWENITAEHALLALLDNYGLQLVRDTKTGIARITIKDPLAPPPLITRVVQLKFTDVTNMVTAAKTVLTDKRSTVLPDARTSQIMVMATEPEQLALDTLIASLDKPTKQVLIETKLVEISSNPTTSKGVNWSQTLGGQNVYFGNGTASGTTTTTTTTPGTTVTTPTPGGGYTTTTSSGGKSSSSVMNLVQSSTGFSANTANGILPSTGFLTADGLHVVLSFLNSTYDAQVVSTPRIVTLDNQMARISVTTTYPVVQMGAGTQNSSGSSSVTYSNVGTILEVTPRISANDYIWLKVSPEVSSHSGDLAVTVSGGSGNASSSYTIPEFDSRKIDSQVLIPNGNTLVMGGLIQDKPTASYTKVPVMGDIPGLGWAFRSESKSLSKDNLIIFLTPTIVIDTDFQPTPTDFLKKKPALMKAPMNPHGVWDGSEPRTDWSNPAPIPNEFNKQKVSPENGNY